ncbi:hypothetical protein F5888DRAFT_1651020 [Russula emetica]|nr:hypothetical protein F5888DRAFT_1651020 [Russula emetica]
MFYSISTPPGTSALAFQASASTPLLAPPFDNSDGLQSNAYITSYSGKLSSHRETQIGLGILLSNSDSLTHVGQNRPVIPVHGPFLEDPPPFLDSPRPPTLNALSPAAALRLQFSPDPEDDVHVVDADLNPSTSAFSIRDWIIHPSSSPATSDALCGSSTVPHQCELAPDALSRPSDTPINASSPSVALAVPGTSVGVNSAVPAVPQTRSPSTIADGPRGSMETIFLQVVERICYSDVPTTACLSPSQTLISNWNSASPHEFDLPDLQYPDEMSAGPDIGRSPGRLFTAPIEAQRELASNSIFAVGTASMSPRNILSPNGCSKGPLVSPDTPVYNVHEGINEYDLQRRANRYRRRYPGRSLDRHWLLKYAGKLNKDGKAIEDYRCYISGCAQVNKRRDHIIVHICSHANERPFACRHCQMTFLRRNECKRHEAGHSGLKPFVCRLCPPPAAKFARQDLLTRHARRAHGITARDHREKFQLTPEMVAWSESGENGPVQKRARMASLRPRNPLETCLE